MQNTHIISLHDTWDEGSFSYMGERHVSKFFVSAYDEAEPFLHGAEFTNAYSSAWDRG